MIDTCLRNTVFSNDRLDSTFPTFFYTLLFPYFSISFKTRDLSVMALSPNKTSSCRYPTIPLLPLWPVQNVFVQFRLSWGVFRTGHNIARPLINWPSHILRLHIRAINKVLKGVLVSVGNCHNLSFPLRLPNCLLEDSFPEDCHNTILTLRKCFAPSLPKSNISPCVQQCISIENTRYCVVAVQEEEENKSKCLPISLFWASGSNQISLFPIGRFLLFKRNSRSSIATASMAYTTLIISPQKEEKNWEVCGFRPKL